MHETRFSRNPARVKTGAFQCATGMETLMPGDLTAKQRATAFQHWCSLIMRECRDLAGLERLSARAQQDRDVRGDAQLQGMVRAEFERRRADLLRETQREQQSRTLADQPRPHYSGTSRPIRSDLVPLTDDVNLDSTQRPASPPPPPRPDPDKHAFHELCERFGAAEKAADENAARAACAGLRLLHERRADVVSSAELDKIERRGVKLHDRLVNYRGQIFALANDAKTAAQRGNAAAAVRLLRRLTAIHATHPLLLDEAGLEKMRGDVARESEGHDDQIVTRDLIRRERAVAAEMKRLAKAVSEYHQAIFYESDNPAKRRRAARAYLQALQEVRLHEKDWMTDFVLELGDVLAKWNSPPEGADQQIDRFLEKLRVSLRRVHRQMGEINRARGS